MQSTDYAIARRIALSRLGRALCSEDVLASIEQGADALHSLQAELGSDTTSVKSIQKSDAPDWVKVVVADAVEDLHSSPDQVQLFKIEKTLRRICTDLAADCIRKS